MRSLGIRLIPAISLVIHTQPRLIECCRLFSLTQCEAVMLDLCQLGSQAVKCPADGAVTLSNPSRANLEGMFGSLRDRHGLPDIHCLVAKLAWRLSGNQMTLDVEDVVDGGVGRKKSLG